jgi:hypothetical protein
MTLMKMLVGGAAVAAILASFRDFRNGGWLAPALPRALTADQVREPVLGYDGMDQETLIDWLTEADLDRETLSRIVAYEAARRNREPVLAAVGDLL